MSPAPLRQPQEGAAESNVLHMNGHRESFAKLPLCVLRLHSLSMGARVTYALLKNYAREEATCFPDEKTLAADLGVTDRTVRDYIKELDDAGLVTIQHRGQGKSNLYTLTDAIPNTSPASSGRKKSSGQGRKDTSGEKRSVSGLGRKKSSGPINEEDVDAVKKTHSSPNGEGADALAPPAVDPEPMAEEGAAQEQREQPPPSSPKKETTSAPWLIAEAILRAQNRVPKRPAVCRILKPVAEYVTDAYRDHPQKPTVKDAAACIAYLLTEPWVKDNLGKLTPKKLGDELGPWLAAGKPKVWAPFSRDQASNGHHPPTLVDGKPSWMENPSGVAFDPDVEKQRVRFIDYWGEPPWSLSAERKAEAIASGCLGEGWA